MNWPWVRRAQERQRLEARIDGITKELAKWRRRVKDLEQSVPQYADVAGSLVKNLADENARLLERIDGHHTAIKALEDRGLPDPFGHDAIINLNNERAALFHRVERLEQRVGSLEFWRETDKYGDDE